MSDWNKREFNESKQYEYNGYIFKNEDEYHKFIFEITKNITIKNNQKILDIGCGNGSFINKILKNNSIESYDLTGIDFCKKSIDYANKHFNGNFINHDIKDILPFEDNSFDVIICISTLFYLTNEIELQKLLSEIKRLSKDDSIIFLGNCMDFDKKILAKNLREKTHPLKSTHLYIKKLEIVKLFEKHKITITDLDELDLEFYTGQKYKFNVLIEKNNYKILDINEFKYMENIDIDKVIEIKKSIEHTGIINKSITVDTKKNIIINGHHRVSALKILNIKYCPINDIDYDNNLVSFSKDSKFKNKNLILQYIKQNKKCSIQSCLHLINNKPISDYEDVINLNIKNLKKKVITFGVFDLMHIGHINLINRLRKYGEYIIVAVHTNDAVKKSKCVPFNSQNIRFESIKNLKNVDEVIYYDDVFETIQVSNIDVFVSGEDQINSSFQKAIDYCKQNNIEHKILKRTPNISTTKIKNLQNINSPSSPSTSS